MDKLIATYAAEGWTLIETKLLTLYAHCLKLANRQEDYARTLLSLLEKMTLTRKTYHLNPSGETTDSNVRLYISEITKLSKTISLKLSKPMSSLWANIAIKPYPQHLDGCRDGYKIAVTYRYFLDKPLTVDTVKARVISMTGGAASREIWMSSSSPVTMVKWLS